MGSDRGRGHAGSRSRLTVAVLGPLEVTLDGRAVPVTAGRQRALLAVLAMSAGRAVSIERLTNALWDADAPVDARRTVQTYVARLRDLLGRAHLEPAPGGYLLRVTDDDVDALRFARLLDTDVRDGERDALLAALSLWRGTPFSDVPAGRFAESVGVGLTERYLSAVERRVDLDLADGRAADVVVELSGLTMAHPLREPLWLRLLVALERCGRQAEALHRYDTARQRIADELGVDPGPELRAAHADLLAGRPVSGGPVSGGLVSGGPVSGGPVSGGPAEAVSPSLPVPRQLPVDAAAFTGRREVGARLERALTAAAERMAVAVLTGPGGVGKSALAIHTAHRLAERFTDGQLYVNLHGATPAIRPLTPLDVLGRFLRAFGVEAGAVPADPDEAAALFRSLVAGRRLLLVLDNALDEAQIRPLLPAGPGCAVLVTSRRALCGLDVTAPFAVDVLTVTESAELLARLIGPDRAEADPAAVTELALRCGRLPLALRIAGARLAARPRWSVRTMVERLTHAHRPLDELELADAGVRASFAMSYDQLATSGDAVDALAARALPLIAVLDGPDLGLHTVAALLDTSAGATEPALERLVDVHLLESGAPGRYAMHDLVRSYAQELTAQRHSPSERAAALCRALRFYVTTGWQTMRLLRPGDYRLSRIDPRWERGGLALKDDKAALGWLEAEHANLGRAIQQAADGEPAAAELAVQLAQALVGFFWVRCHWTDWIDAARTALRAADRLADPTAIAQLHNDLGLAQLWLGGYDEARAHLDTSMAIRVRLGDRVGQASILNNRGVLQMKQGRLDDASACLRAGLRLWREVGDLRGIATSLSNLGIVHLQLGAYDDAVACQESSLDYNHRLGHRQAEAANLSNIGELFVLQGRTDEAIDRLRQALDICRDLGFRVGEAMCLHALGRAYQRQDRLDEALRHHGESLALRRGLGDLFGQAESLRDLGGTLRSLGRPDEARRNWLDGLSISERLRTAEAGTIRDLLAALPHGEAPAKAL